MFSHPPRNVVSRAVVATQNLLFRMVGRDFRTFAHPPDAMLAVLAEHGLQRRGTPPRPGVAGRRRRPLILGGQSSRAWRPPPAPCWPVGSSRSAAAATPSAYPLA